MKILIAGAGEVGTHLAKLLGQENHDITLMDSVKERLTAVRDNAELLIFVGNCTSLKDLSEAGVADSDHDDVLAARVERRRRIAIVLGVQNHAVEVAFPLRQARVPIAAARRDQGDPRRDGRRSYRVK